MKNQQHKNSFSLRTSFSELDRKFPLSSFVYNKSEAWYDAKHKSFSIDEIALVNSLEVKQCPYCHSETIKKNGKRKDGTQRYHCLSCGRGFNPLTGSLFDSRKIPVAEWIEFLVHLFQYESLSISSLDNRNVRSTGRYWIKKVFEALKHYQDGIMLGNVFWIDETFVKKKPADTVKAQNGKHIKGISRNLICVATATDGYNSVLYVVGSGKPSSSKLIKAMEGHLKDGARMIDDDEVAHSLLASRFDLIRETHPTKKTQWTWSTGFTDSSKDTCHAMARMTETTYRTGAISSVSSGITTETSPKRLLISWKLLFRRKKSSNIGQ